MSLKERTLDLLKHLASRPGHDEVKADFRQLLIEEFGVELNALDFERRVPEVRGRLDALIGRTVFEAKKNLDQEWSDVIRRMPDYLADRERDEGERFVGIASDGLKWVVFERAGNTLVKVKEFILDPDKAEQFLAWLDGAVALKSALSPDPLTVRIELGQDSVAFRRASEKLAALWAKLTVHFTAVVEQHYKRDILPAETIAVGDLVKTYATFDELRRQGRDSVWTYVARNLSRPLALSFKAGWPSVVVGNPPWVAFRHMSEDLQKRFRDLAKEEKVYVGGKFATQADLSALFTVRAVLLYLRAGGRIAFVLPLAALTRGQFEKLRAGAFTHVQIAWDEAWTMDDSVQPLFPVPSCVVFGRRRARAKPMPETVRAFSGTLPYRDAPEDVADKCLTVAGEQPKPVEGVFEGGSAYRKAFRQGATLVPRMLCLVERKGTGRLGSDPTAPFVMSRRSSQEKQPWKSLLGIEHRVEADFLRPVLLGESILPYRVFSPFEGVVPVTDKGDILDAQGAANRGWSGLHGWMRAAEAVWNENAESGEMKLVERWNYHNELGAQFPLARLRVVYSKAGTLPAACLVRDASVIDHKLYWSAVGNEAEAYYLAAILNSETVRSRTAALQSRGQWGARDFDKVMFTLRIPRFDPNRSLHRQLAAAGRRAETMAAKIELPDRVKFQRARKLVRSALAEAGIAGEIDALVAQLLDSQYVEMGE